VRVLLHLRALYALLDVLVGVQLSQPQHLLFNVCLPLSVVGTGNYVHLDAVDLLLDGLELEYGFVIDLHLWQLPPVDHTLYHDRQWRGHHLVVVVDLDLDLRDAHDLCIAADVGARLMLQVVIALCAAFLAQVELLVFLCGVLRRGSRVEVALVEILGFKEGVLDVRLQDHCLLVIIFFLERYLVIA
jgi:hypothetical protein